MCWCIRWWRMCYECTSSRNMHKLHISAHRFWLQPKLFLANGRLMWSNMARGWQTVWGQLQTAVLSEKPQDHVASSTGWPGCICHYHTPMKSQASVWVESSVFKIHMHCHVYLVLIQPRLLQIIQMFSLKGRNAVFCLQLKLLWRGHKFWLCSW